VPPAADPPHAGGTSHMLTTSGKISPFSERCRSDFSAFPARCNALQKVVNLQAVQRSGRKGAAPPAMCYRICQVEGSRGRSVADFAGV